MKELPNEMERNLRALIKSKYRSVREFAAKAKSKSLEAHNETFRIGDRILQLQNNPEKDIYNGQIGKISSIDEENSEECMVYGPMI